MTADLPDRPLVSLITPGWNGAAFVHRLLTSVLAQTYRPLEYIYVDDGSTDGSSRIVQGYQEAFARQDIRFLYVRKENGGVSSAVNVGLKLVSGVYLSCPEYDDWLSPDAVARRVAYLEAHPEYAVVTADAWVYDEADIENPIRLLSEQADHHGEAEQFQHLLLSRSIFVAGCHLIRTRHFLETHPDRALYDTRIGPNWQLLLPLYYRYKRGFIAEPLFHHLIRNNSISNRRVSYKERLDTLDEYEHVLAATLQTIAMPADQRTAYLDLVRDKYNRERFCLAIVHGSREEVEACYRRIQARQVNTYKDDLKYWLLRHRSVARAYYALRSRL